MSSMKMYTADEFVSVAARVGDTYAVQAMGEDVEVSVPAAAPWRTYVLDGAAAGTIHVTGAGDGNAWREGAGRGHRGKQ